MNEPAPADVRVSRTAIVLTPLLTIVLLFGLLEIVVRVFIDDGMNFDLEMWKYANQVKQRSADPLIGHEHRPNAHAHLMGVDVDINSLGYRGREMSINRAPGVRRIVMLGDSFTEGWGVPVDETVSRRLEILFGQRGMAVEVVNTGVGNSGSVQEVQGFLTRHSRLNPDVVVLNFDFRSAIPVPRYADDGWLVRHSEARMFLSSGADALQRLMGVKKKWADDYLALFDGPGWIGARDAIVRLVEYCREHRMALLIANWPELHDVQHYVLDSITDRIRALANAEHVAFIDLLDAVKTQDSSTLWVTPADPHPNGHANRLFAEYLLPRLVPMVSAAASTSGIASP
jgi:lysophospholipase L1-like esterase